MNIGIIKEGKTPVDHRTPFTPAQCKEIIDTYPTVNIFVQSSNVRAYTDQEYIDQGINVVNDISHCDILFGVKEVNVDELIPDKTYFFFSHTIKKQPYNRKLLQTILKKNIRLIDYECLKNHKNTRVVAFGRYAGIVGAYNGLMAYGMKHKLWSLKRAKDCFDMDELFSELKKIKQIPFKTVITGGGRVAQGAIEVLEEAGIRQVHKNDFMFNTFAFPVFCQLETEDYNLSADGSQIVLTEFYKNPSNGYVSAFGPYTKTADLFIACAYWDPKAPRLFELRDLTKNEFNINVIADITCDIDGSVPTTVRSTTIDQPFYDFDRETLKEIDAFSSNKSITVMSIDNLPCELSRDASEGFGEQLLKNIIPSLVNSPNDDIVKKGTITQSGQLTEYFSYLQDYINE